MFQEKTRFYEEILVLHPDVPEKEQKEIYTSQEEIIQSSGGRIHHLNAWGSRPLANPSSKGFSRGLYFHMLFSASPKAVHEMRQQLRINDRILYFHHEKLSKGQTPDGALENFVQLLERTVQREKERQARAQKRQGGFPK